MRNRALAVLIAAALTANLSFGEDEALIGSKQNPIKVNGVEMERFYFKFLRTPDGEEVEYERVGSVGKGPYGNILDWYKVKTRDGKQEWDVYIDMYHPELKSLPQIAPPGLLTLGQFTDGRLKGKRKRYIGVTLPTGSRFTPLLAETPDGQLVAAQIVPSESGRDIQVLAGDGVAWQPLGDRGRALTQEAKGYPFLADMRFARDGALWVMATFTFPDRHILYRLDGAKWQRMGPASGLQPPCESWMIWSAGLLFGKDAKPFSVQNRQKEGLFVARLQDTGWVEVVPPKRILAIQPPNTVDMNEYSQGFARSNAFLHAKHYETNNSVWLFWDWRGTNDTLISALRIEGPADGDYIGPFDLLSLPGSRYLQSQAVSKDGRIALKLTDDDEENGKVFVLSSSNSWRTVTTKATPRFPCSTYYAELAWSPDGDLYAVCDGRTNCVTLLHLGVDEWETAAHQHQPVTDGFTLSPKVFFHKGRRPIVTWGDIFR